MRAEPLDMNVIAVWSDETPQTPGLRLISAHGGTTCALLSLGAVIKLAEVCKEIQIAAGREPV